MSSCPPTRDWERGEEVRRTGLGSVVLLGWFLAAEGGAVERGDIERVHVDVGKLEEASTVRFVVRWQPTTSFALGEGEGEGKGAALGGRGAF